MLTSFPVLLVGFGRPWGTDVGDESLGRYSQEKYHPNLEGISYSEGKLYFVSKTMKKLYVLDLDKGTYVSSATDDYSLYSGEFKNGPDHRFRDIIQAGLPDGS